MDKWRRRQRALGARVLCFFLVFVTACICVNAQRSPEFRRPGSPSDPNLGRLFFDMVKRLLRDSYYDRNFRGIDIEKNNAATSERLHSMRGMGEMFSIVSEALLALDDPHTYLLPPPRVREHEYGFTTMMMGESCLVTYVRPGSGAYDSGLQTGDEIVAFGTIVPNRRNLWKIKLTLYALNPLVTLPLDVKGADGKIRRVELQAALVSAKEKDEVIEKLGAEEKANPFLCKDISPDLAVCKVWTFAVKKSAFDDLYLKIRSKKKVVLDFRGTREGNEDTLLDFTEHFFSGDILAYKKRDRKNEKERLALGRRDAFGGEVAIILDSRSAGAAELFARIVQLENRGKVYGDVSAGSVTSSEVLILQVPRYVGQQPGMDVLALMGISVSEPIMKDGSRIEGIGVVPDEAFAPNGYAIRERLDPILAHVIGKMGLRISAKQAGANALMKLETIERIEVLNKPTKNEIETTPTIMIND